MTNAEYLKSVGIQFVYGDTEWLNATNTLGPSAAPEKAVTLHGPATAINEFLAIYELSIVDFVTIVPDSLGIVTVPIAGKGE